MLPPPPTGGPEPRPPGRLVAAVLIPLALLLTALLFAVGGWLAAERPVHAGQCVDLAGGTWGGHRVVDCGSPESDYLVVHRIARDGRCHPDYDLFELDGSTVACGILDVRVGDCVHQPSFGLGTKVRCADPAATLLVTAVEATAAGESACTPDSEVYWVYGEAALTHCFKAVPALV